jgi:hypothetical protein
VANNPLDNGHNGNHDNRTGRFAKGNKAAVGRRARHAEHVGKLRTAMLAAMTPESVLRIMATLEAEAENGNIVAIKEYLDRAVGKPLPLDVVERLEQLEKLLGVEVPEADHDLN